MQQVKAGAIASWHLWAMGHAHLRQRLTTALKARDGRTLRTGFDSFCWNAHIHRMAVKVSTGALIACAGTDHSYV